VPIKSVAGKELDLNVHQIDTFTGWTPPQPFNMVVAVSFGLLVPPRILNAAKYGGLNVHPSMLPE
jgi:methionyl-tRNA formyltransferase